MFGGTMTEEEIFVVVLKANAMTEAIKAKQLRNYSLSLDSQKQADIAEATSRELDLVAKNIRKKINEKPF